MQSIEIYTAAGASVQRFVRGAATRGQKEGRRSGSSLSFKKNKYMNKYIDLALVGLVQEGRTSAHGAAQTVILSLEKGERNSQLSTFQTNIFSRLNLGDGVQQPSGSLGVHTMFSCSELLCSSADETTAAGRGGEKHVGGFRAKDVQLMFATAVSLVKSHSLTFNKRVLYNHEILSMLCCNDRFAH